MEQHPPSLPGLLLPGLQAEAQDHVTMMLLGGITVVTKYIFNQVLDCSRLLIITFLLSRHVVFSNCFHLHCFIC